MSENLHNTNKLATSPNLELGRWALHDHAEREKREAIRDAIIDTLKHCDRPTPRPELVARVDDALNRQFGKEYIRRRVETICNQGLIKRLERNIYAHLEFDDSEYESIADIDNGILSILKEKDGPVSVSQIENYLTLSCGREIEIKLIRSRLSLLRRWGKIQHLDPGVYADLEFDAQSYESPLSLKESVRRFFTKDAGPMSCADIVNRLPVRADGYMPTRSTVRSCLTDLCRQEKIKRLREGIYAHLEFDGEQFQRPLSVKEAIISALEQIGGPMSRSEIKEVINLAIGQEFSLYSIRNQLGILFRDGAVKRLGDGVYACLGFNGEYKSPPTIQESILKFLRKQEYAPVKEIVSQVSACGVNKIEESIKHQLHALCKEDKIRRLELGVYADLEFDASRYCCQVVTIDRKQILAVLKQNGTTMTVREVVACLTQEMGMRVEEKRMHARLLYLWRRGFIKRLDPGLYADLGFDEKSFRPQVTIGGGILKILKNSEVAMSIEEITDEFNRSFDRQTNRDGIKQRASVLCQQSRITRASRGLYIYLEFKDVLRETVKSDDVYNGLEGLNGASIRKRARALIGGYNEIPTVAEVAKDLELEGYKMNNSAEAYVTILLQRRQA